jgi:hypothetical protein
VPAATAITGAAGAYYVVAELSQRGWIASPTCGNAPRTDILAQEAEGTRVAAIQVKARSPQTRPWILLGGGGKIPDPGAEGGNEWFVLVSLHGPGLRPDFHIVPRSHVVAMAPCDTKEWLSYPRRDGQPRTTKRVVIKLDDLQRYHERWDLLEGDADAAPWMIPERIWDLAPKWHPPVTLGPFARP